MQSSPPRTPPIHPHRCKHAEIDDIRVKDIEDKGTKTDRPHTDKLPPPRQSEERERARGEREQRERAKERVQGTATNTEREHYKRALEQRGSIQDTHTRYAHQHRERAFRFRSGAFFLKDREPAFRLQGYEI